VVTTKDLVDRIIEQWDDEKPDLDTSALAAMNRVVRLGRHIEAHLRQALAPFGLDVWSYDVLAALRRQGKPYDLSPTELRRAAILTSGAMTNRIDRLEERNLVERFADPDDRRALRVHLTDEGLRLIDEAIEIRFSAAEDLASRLTAKEIHEVSRLLRKLLLAMPEEVVRSG
jgi:DNA-binding MarR family transcriptional regulator